jgi:hypothetical protein
MRTPDVAMRTSPSHVYYPWRLQSQHVGATATIFVAAQPPEPIPERTTDGCCYYHFKTSFKPDGSVGAGGGSADPARTSTEGAAPTTPPEGVIDRMRHCSLWTVDVVDPGPPAPTLSRLGPVLRRPAPPRSPSRPNSLIHHSTVASLRAGVACRAFGCLPSGGRAISESVSA